MGDGSIPGNAAALQEYADQLDQCADSILNLTYDTSQTTAAIRERAYWTGDAADRYTSYCNGVTSGLQGIPAPLHGIASAVRSYAHALASAQGQAQTAAPEADQTTSQVQSNTEDIELVWKATESVRKTLDGLLAPGDIAGVDGMLYALLKTVQAPAKLLDEVDEALETAETAQGTAEQFATLIKAAELIEETGPEIDSAVAEVPRLLQGFVDVAPQLEWLDNGLSVLGIVGDVGTLFDPLDHGAMGWTDRGVAFANGGLLAANLCLDEIPVVGEVVLVATGVYLAGDFLYHHWTGFRNVCNDVGSATVSVAKTVVHDAESVVSTVESWLP